MSMNMSPPWIKVFFSKYFQMGKKHLDVGIMKEKKFEKQSICLLNKNYVYLASESPRSKFSLS